MLEAPAAARPSATAQVDFEPLEPDRYMLKKEVARLLRYTVQHVDRLARSDPEFPQKVKIGANRVGFLTKEIYAYLAKREAAARLQAEQRHPNTK